MIKFLALLLATMALGCAMGCENSSSAGGAKPKKEKVVIGGETFELELAADPQSRQTGLMNREVIADHGGMLFVFPDKDIAVQNFWMGHCLTDMDIIYLDSHSTVTAVHRMKFQPPQRKGESDEDYEKRIPHYSSGYPAQFAIELKAGSLDRLKVKVDDRIPLETKRLKGMAR